MPVRYRPTPSAFILPPFTITLLCFGALLLGMWSWNGVDLILPLLSLGFLTPCAYYGKLRRYQEATLRRELTDLYGYDLRKFPLVTVSVPNGPGQIDKDVALVAGDGETLRLYGDYLPYTLPKANIRQVHYRRFPSTLWPDLEIKWESDQGVHTLYLTPKGPVSPWRANRILDSLRLALEYGRPNLPPPSRYYPPTEDIVLPP